jgi:hypothetical protein
MPHPYDDIPPLAGLASYEAAARVGFPVDENVARLVRLHWVERRLMAALIAHLTAEPVWEVKCALALHQWQSAEHVEALRSRIGEMRHPAPALDVAPDPALDLFLEELLHARGTAELLAGFHQTAYAALAGAYRDHLAQANPLVDHPTARVLRIALADTEQAVAWGSEALAAVTRSDPDAAARAGRWAEHLRGLLAAAGGVAGAGAIPPDRAPPALRSARPFVPDFHPRRDERFTGAYNFEFPPHVVYNAPGVPADERTLALLCKRALEMDVPEMMASFLTERAGQPWEFHRDYSRQLWDEARHAMMGTVALHARGIDWKTALPLNVSFALRLNLHATPLERQIMLYAIEQSLMPADTGKRFEYDTALEAGDALAAHFQDYDWADEVLHAQIGRRMLRRDGITREQAIERAAEIHAKTWAALVAYRSREPQHNWWPEFVRRSLGHEGSDVRLGEERPSVVTE